LIVVVTFGNALISSVFQDALAWFRESETKHADWVSANFGCRKAILFLLQFVKSQDPDALNTAAGDSGELTSFLDLEDRRSVRVQQDIYCTLAVSNLLLDCTDMTNVTPVGSKLLPESWEEAGKTEAGHALINQAIFDEHLTPDQSLLPFPQPNAPPHRNICQGRHGER
jgi:hypothetical protein